MHVEVESTLRFRTVGNSSPTSRAGLAVRWLFGDWDGTPFAPAHGEIIVIAQPR